MFLRSRNIKKRIMAGWVLISLGALLGFWGYTVMESPENFQPRLTGFSPGNVLLGMLDVIRPSLKRMAKRFLYLFD